MVCSLSVEPAISFFFSFSYFILTCIRYPIPLSLFLSLSPTRRPYFGYYLQIGVFSSFCPTSFSLLLHLVHLFPWFFFGRPIFITKSKKSTSAIALVNEESLLSIIPKNAVRRFRQLAFSQYQYHDQPRVILQVPEYLPTPKLADLTHVVPDQANALGFGLSLPSFRRLVSPSNLAECCLHHLLLFCTLYLRIHRPPPFLSHAPHALAKIKAWPSSGLVSQACKHLTWLSSCLL